ncbi:MAG TPA: hypothetical protein PLC42_00455 [Parachlamydiaceae bacterium]|nr:hypothetical protein [Parachlamydiaceae bacterium]
MTQNYEELLNKRSADYAKEVEQALLDGNFDAAIQACLARGTLQARQTYRMDFNSKNQALNALAKAIQNYANTMQGFGFNGTTGLNLAQAGSGMFGLVGLNKDLLQYFTATKLDFDQTSKIGQAFQTAFSLPKSLIDESNQYHRVIKQSDVDNAKRIQEDYKEKVQRAHAAAQELLQQLKTLQESEHRARMSASGG